MATHAGSEGKVLVGSNQIAEIKSWSLEITSDTVDASIIGASWRKNQATIKSWSGSFDGFWDETDTMGQGALTAEATVTLNLPQRVIPPVIHFGLVRCNHFIHFL